MRETSASIAQLALDGNAKKLQGIGKTIEEKIVELRRDRRHRGAREEARRRAARGRPLHAPAGTRPEDRGADLEGARRRDARRPQGGGRAGAAAHARGARGEERGEDPRGARLRRRRRRRPATGGSSATGSARCRRSSPSCAALPAAISVSEAGSVRRRKETFKDLDVIACATDPAELTAHFVEMPWVVDVAAHGDTKATVVSRDGLRFDLRVVPPESFGNLLQHFTGSKDHNVAMREDAVRRGLSISEYGVTNTKTGKVFQSADEDAVYEHLGYAADPARAARELRRARGGARGRAAEARRGEGRPRRPPHALALVGRRQEHAHGDARGGGRARLRVLRRHRPLALPPRRPARRAARGDRGAAQAVPDADDPRRRRGEHPLERRGGHGRRGPREARLGRRVCPQRARQPPDRARARGDGEPVRRLHRPPHRPADQQAPAARCRRRARHRGRARDRARSSR